ncbi:MAG TPA: hypothetical protein VN420_02550 [Candidatus Fimivivens sp.]|nr:hypothetical protein [Candidatus Fimivivens sp.]
MSGSTALAIRGVDVVINNDIDILTDKSGAEQIDELLSEYRISRPDYSETEKYRSYFGKYEIEGVGVEVMGKFQYRLSDGAWSTPNQTNEIIMMEYEGMKIPLLTLEQELKEYESMGKVDKVAKIQARMNS